MESVYKENFATKKKKLVVGDDHTLKEEEVLGEDSHRLVAKMLSQFGFFKFESEIDLNILMDVLDKDKDGKFSLEDFQNSF